MEISDAIRVAAPCADNKGRCDIDCELKT